NSILNIYLKFLLSVLHFDMSHILSIFFILTILSGIHKKRSRPHDSFSSLHGLSFAIDVVSSRLPTHRASFGVSNSKVCIKLYGDAGVIRRCHVPLIPVLIWYGVRSQQKKNA
ncbi:MAG: hypothetical protein JWM56_320, partial [Candidatus Peribacteria bacterium]|nr:hypothetical protein [Candidatus Peribacteria bacterium]